MTDRDQMFQDVPPEFFEQYFTTHSVAVNGLDLSYTEWNPAGATTLLLVHGLGVQAHTWDPLACALSEEFRVICPDLRGHGNSDWGPDYWIRSFVSDLEGIVEQLGLDRFAVVGHSLGAKLSLSYAGEHPESVTHLVLSDTGPEMPKAASKFTQSVIGSAGEVKGFRTEEEAAEHFRRLNPEWREVFFGLHARHQLRRNWADKLVLKADPQTFWLTGSAGRREDPYIWEMTGRIAAPTLVLWGERSPFFDEELADRLLGTLAAGRLTKVPDCGHYIPREQPETVVAAVRSFIAG